MSRRRIATTNEILEQLAFIRNKKQEYFVCLSIDGDRRLIARRVVTIGLLDSVQVHPRETFAPVITDRAAYVIVAHNHPSGNVAPSGRDIATTQLLVSAGILLGVPVRDHFIVAANRHFSFRSHHYI